MTQKKVLTIAGTDVSGGAGYSADIKTFEDHDLYGFCALTTIVSMDPSTWAHRVHHVPLEVLDEQIETALSLNPDTIKTGMLPNEEVISRARKAIEKSNADYFVFDPVMVCKGDDTVLNPGVVDSMQKELLPITTIVTPNLVEAGNLAGMNTPKTIYEVKEAAKKIHEYGPKYVVVKGGTGLEGDDALDIFYDGEKFYGLYADKLEKAYNHGAGCTFAAAVASNFTNGLEPLEAVKEAKAFVTSAIKHGSQMNEHVGVVRHNAYNKVDKVNVQAKEL